MVDYPYMRLVGVDGTVWQMPAEFRTFTVSEIEQTREGVTADGSYVEDLLTAKNQYTVTFSLLSGTDLNKALAIRSTNKPATLYFRETYTSTLLEKQVRVRPITDRKRVLAIGDGLWGDVTIEMREI